MCSSKSTIFLSKVFFLSFSLLFQIKLSCVAHGMAGTLLRERDRERDSGQTGHEMAWCFTWRKEKNTEAVGARQRSKSPNLKYTTWPYCYRRKIYTSLKPNAFCHSLLFSKYVFRFPVFKRLLRYKWIKKKHLQKVSYKQALLATFFSALLQMTSMRAVCVRVCVFLLLLLGFFFLKK